MKSLIASFIIFALVTVALFAGGTWISQKTEMLHTALCQFPRDTKGDPDVYGIAMKDAHNIWKDMRRCMEMTVPRRLLDPLDRALQGIEAGWLCDDDALYRRSLAEALTATEQLRAYEGISLSAILYDQPSAQRISSATLCARAEYPLSEGWMPSGLMYSSSLPAITEYRSFTRMPRDCISAVAASL